MATKPSDATGSTGRYRLRPTRRTGLAIALLTAGTLLLAWGGLLGPVLQTNARAAAPVAVNQCDGSHNVGGQAVECTVTVTNNLDLATGLGSSSVVLHECYGAANDPPTVTCTITPTNYPDSLTTTINQCNGSGNGGKAEVKCSVDVINNITGNTTRPDASIKQCQGSGTGGGTEPTILCTPLGNTTNATVDQCNVSGNGGGATERVHCTVGPSTQAAALRVAINQCNGSANGGQATIECRSQIINNIIAPPVTTPPVTTPPVTTPPVTTPPVTTPPVTTPPVTTPPVTTPPVTTPPATSPPVSSPPVSSPPVSSPPVLTPPVSSPPFVPPPGLTGDSPLRTGSSSHPLIGVGLALLTGGIALLIPRRRRR